MISHHNHLWRRGALGEGVENSQVAVVRGVHQGLYRSVSLEKKKETLNPIRPVECVSGDLIIIGDYKNGHSSIDNRRAQRRISDRRGD